jgi:8-oxo-dGTP diphosphatase
MTSHEEDLTPLNESSALPAQPRPAVEVAAGLIFRNGKLLITQRLPGDHLGGLWEFPGGKREGQESFQDCLRRELLEELGIEVQPGQLLDSFTHVYPEKTVHLRFFLCACAAIEPAPLGCHDLAWVRRDELRRYEFPAADARLLDLIESSPDLWNESSPGSKRGDPGQLSY